MTSKKDHPTFSETQLRGATEEPMRVLATNYRKQEAEAKPRGFESQDGVHASADIEDWIKPCEEEMEELEKLK